jgi:hypothetical protein
MAAHFMDLGSRGFIVRSFREPVSWIKELRGSLNDVALVAYRERVCA